jgi:FkbM family methyltransferase
MNFPNLTETELPEIISQWEASRVHDVDFFGFQLLNRPLNQILDVGANRGQSIVSIRTLLPSVEIHSFEANQLLHPVLEALVSSTFASSVVIHPYGLSDVDGGFKLYIPFSKGVIFLEEASTSLEYFKKPWVAEKFRERGGLELNEVSCVLKIGDSLSLAPDLIKIDVEGAESLVLRGLTQTINKRRPVIMVENSDWFGVQEVMLPLAYSPFLYRREQNCFVPFEGTATNTFYFPNETPPLG